MTRKIAVLLTIIILFTFPVIARPVLKIGSSTPSLSLADPAGKSFALEQYLGKDIILLSFFTSWSRSGKEEALFLQNLHAAHEKDGLKIIGVSFDRKINDLVSFISANQISYAILHDKKLKTLNDFGIVVIPTLFVIDRESNIQSVYVDFDKNVKEALEKEVNKLIAPNPKS
jgi:peroxiredoxin